MFAIFMRIWALVLSILTCLSLRTKGDANDPQVQAELGDVTEEVKVSSESIGRDVTHQVISERDNTLVTPERRTSRQTYTPQHDRTRFITIKGDPSSTLRADSSDGPNTPNLSTSPLNSPFFVYPLSQTSATLSPVSIEDSPETPRSATSRLSCPSLSPPSFWSSATSTTSPPLTPTQTFTSSPIIGRAESFVHRARALSLSHKVPASELGALALRRQFKGAPLEIKECETGAEAQLPPLSATIPLRARAMSAPGVRRSRQHKWSGFLRPTTASQIAACPSPLPVDLQEHLWESDPFAVGPEIQDSYFADDVYERFAPDKEEANGDADSIGLIPASRLHVNHPDLYDFSIYEKIGDRPARKSRSKTTTCRLSRATREPKRVRNSIHIYSAFVQDFGAQAPCVSTPKQRLIGVHPVDTIDEREAPAALETVSRISATEESANVDNDQWDESELISAYNNV